VAAAALAFLPWAVELVARADRVSQVTAWMHREVEVHRLLEAWGLNLVRVLADFPAADSLLLLGVIPLAWVLWRFCTAAPRSPRLFICVLFLIFAAAVLVPDLVQGGERSLHPRYVLPAFLALELATAYVVAAGWHASSVAGRIGWRSGLVLVLMLGIWSDWLILQADTWWSKNFSADNRRVAALINEAERPLLIVTESSVGLGEAISLAYDLGAQVVVRGEPRSGEGVATTGFSDLFLLTPSSGLRAALAADYDLQPLPGTWQWCRAVPRAKGMGT
jgi:hypothetical protein